MTITLNEAYRAEIEKNQFIEIPLEQRHPENKDCVFLWVYCKDAKPYAKYSDFPNEQISCVFCILRWDGSFGTLGGKVDPGESLVQALYREALEEVNLDISALNTEVVPFSSLRMNNYHIHAYACEVSENQLYAIRENAHLGSTALQECSGYNVIHVTRYRKNANGTPNGIDLFLNNNFAATARAELLKLIQEQRLL